MPLGILALLCSPVRSLQTLKVIQCYYLVLHSSIYKWRNQGPKTRASTCGLCMPSTDPAGAVDGLKPERSHQLPSVSDFLSVFHTFSYFFPNAPLLKKNIYWRIVDLQLCCKTKLYYLLLCSKVNQQQICICPLFFFQISFPYRLLQSIGQSSLCYAVSPYQSPILYVVVCMYQFFPPSLPLW